eukprot:scaffold27699_cov63-Phaeocystis_antarctica.AAC.5
MSQREICGYNLAVLTCADMTWRHQQCGVCTQDTGHTSQPPSHAHTHHDTSHIASPACATARLSSGCDLRVLQQCPALQASPLAPSLRDFTEKVLGFELAARWRRFAVGGSARG